MEHNAGCCQKTTQHVQGLHFCQAPLALVTCQPVSASGLHFHRVGSHAWMSNKQEEVARSRDLISGWTSPAVMLAVNLFLRQRSASAWMAEEDCPDFNENTLCAS